MLNPISRDSMISAYYLVYIYNIIIIILNDIILYNIQRLHHYLASSVDLYSVSDVISMPDTQTWNQTTTSFTSIKLIHIT